MTMQTLARRRGVRPGLKGTALWWEGQGSLRNIMNSKLKEEKKNIITFCFYCFWTLKMLCIEEPYFTGSKIELDWTHLYYMLFSVLLNVPLV